MKKSSLVFFVFVCLFALKSVAQQGVVYLTSQTGEPWGGQSNFTDLNALFGNTYDTAYFENANPNSVFANNNCLVYMEGSAGNDIAMSNFIAFSQITIQNWVSNGGHLFMNSAGLNSDMNCGFGGVVFKLLPSYIYASLTGDTVIGKGAHAIFNNATYPSGFNWTGNYFSHAIITGGSADSLIKASTQAQGSQISLSELDYGSGKVIFGTLTMPSMQNPQPGADNLRRSLFDYMHPCGPNLVSDESKQNSKLTIFPNPGIGLFNVKYKGDKSSQLTVAVFDLDGRIIFYQKIDKFNGTYDQFIDLGNYTKGIYILRIVSDIQIVNSKIICD